ncbi:MAG: helix-turn-helix transcriptional regulator [Alphaproteobacteria bacterium]|nr:helix-turn-helix transcriptional regulator [Alphaproteobacteria bacterium]|tara:strand:- start:579 stop:1277 length:699 start_codon:yes stop_codon:yes gene_type:complete
MQIPEPSQSSKQRERFLALNAEQQSTWLDPAEKEFSKHGFKAASMNRILLEAGASKGQSYYYFQDKADLYRAVIERAFERFLALADLKYPKPSSPEDFWRQSAANMATVSAIMHQDARLADLARGIHQDLAAQQALAEFMQMLTHRLTLLIVIGREVGAVRQDVPLDLLVSTAFAAMRQVDNWFANHIKTVQPAEHETLNLRATQLIFMMLAPAEMAARLTRTLSTKSGDQK